jgi:transposase
MLSVVKTYSRDLREKMLAAVDGGMPRKGDGERLRGLLGDAQAVAETAQGNRRCRAQEEAWDEAEDRRLYRGSASFMGAVREEPRRHARRAPPTVGTGVWHQGQRLHHKPGHPSARVDLQAKTLGATERDEKARARWREWVSRIDPHRLVFVDECGTNVGMTPLRARAPKGERAYGKAPRNRGKNTTLLASMELCGMGPCLAVEGSTTKDVFEAYVERVLTPSLSPGQIVVMDNLSAHKGERVRELIEGRGCELLFLPSYSPDFSPIEEAFGKVKSVLRRVEARTKGALVVAIGRALDAVAPEDTRGWFSHCDYTPRDQLS